MRPYFIVAAVLLFSLGAYYLLFKSPVFKVSTVTVSGDSQFVNHSELRHLIELNTLGEHIFRTDVARLSEVSADAFLGAKDIVVTRNYPNSLHIQVFERSPLAVVYNPKNTPQEYFLVDEEGFLLGLVDINKTNLPKVEYNEPLFVGTFIDEDLTPLYLTLIRSLDSEGLKASSISVLPKHIKFYLDVTTEIFINRSQDVPSSIKILSQLKKQLDSRGSNVTKIDLRYDKVVVQYDEN
jgi:cell division septal protein FtsQ